MSELPKPQGFNQSNRQSFRPLIEPKPIGWRYFWAGLIANPKTFQVSHSKLWFNVAGATMTYKFATTPNAPEWLWFAYGSMVGGYALIKRGIATIPQLAEIKQKGQKNVADFE